MNNLEKVFCAEPWKQIFIGPNSGVKTCCSGDIELGNLNEKSLEEIISGDVLRDIKTSIINGIPHKNCALCYKLENSGAPNASQRSRTREEVDNFDFYKNNLEYHTPEIMDIRWSNTCNLACNYCNSYFSSVWASIKKEFQISPDYNEVFNYLEDKGTEVKQLFMLGGEPFLEKKYLSLLNNLNSNVSIVLFTNLSVNLKNNEIFNLLTEKFRYITFNISFETLGEKFEYVRHGAHWNKFLENLEILKSLRKENSNYKIQARPLYCIYSVFHLEEFFRFCVDNELSIRWQKIEGGPQELNVNNLPLQFRIKAVEEINECSRHYNISKFDFETLEGIKDNLLKENKVLDKNKFLEFHEDLETKYHQKKKSFLVLWPIYNNYYE